MSQRQTQEEETRDQVVIDLESLANEAAKTAVGTVVGIAIGKLIFDKDEDT